MTYADMLREWAHKDMIANASREPAKFRSAAPNDYQRISRHRSFYENVSSPELMPELSPARVCFECGHPWAEHLNGACTAHIYVRIDVDETERRTCGCGRPVP